MGVKCQYREMLIDLIVEKGPTSDREKTTLKTEDRINALETQDEDHHDHMALPKVIQIDYLGGNFTIRR